MQILVIPIIFIAMFIQSLAGFGSALIAMPFLIALLGPDVARPAFSLIGQTAGLMFLYQYRNDWRFADVKLVILGTLLGIPIGTWVANALPEETFMLVLGIIIICYALYALSGFKLSQMHLRWGTFFGFFSGILHSAYNVGGPPLVMYNSTHDWESRRFKGNIQAIFFVTGMFVIAEHFLAGRMTMLVFQNYLLMAPTMFVALIIGFWAEKFIKQDLFRKMVMVFLLLIGVSLIFNLFFT